MKVLSAVLAFVLSIPAYAIDVNDLGFADDIVKPNPEFQNLLNERAEDLKLHQKLGLLTLVLVGATAATAEEGKKAPESHENLGMAAGISYFTTAYFSLTAPEDPAAEAKSSSWNMKIHRTMAFIHFPAMLLLPFAGKSASDSYERGEALHGLGKHKKTLANLAVTSMAIAALSVTIDF